MIILGIHDGHNATATVLRDGKIVACASEERFSRIKNDSGYPSQAVDYVLQASGVRSEQLDAVAVVTKDHENPILYKIKRDTFFTIGDYIREMHEYWRPLLYENTETDFWERIWKEARFKKNNDLHNIDFIKATPKEKWGDEFLKERIGVVSNRLKVPLHKIHLIDHHTAHAYYAYCASPHVSTRKAVVVTADSWGDECNATISIVENGKLKEIHRTTMCILARIYRFMTLLLGMRPLEHEYKVMGLAPYAKGYIREPAYKIFKETLVVDGIDFKWNKKPTDLYFYFRDKFEGLRFDGIAGGLQLWIEEMICEWITNIMNYTKTEVLYYSGGLSMNVKANKIIADLPVLKDFYVPPSGSDESLAMGGAYKLAVDMGNETYPLKDAYLGFGLKDEISKVIQPFLQNRDYQVIESPDDELIAGLLVNGKVIARCVGNMEFGARALGNRSILCDPSKYENIKLINEKIKFRDFWMPFTPSILKERAQDYIVNTKGLKAYYMTVAFDSTLLAQRELKAAMHPYDYTIRPQIVTPEQNPEYYSLIKAFEKKTGIGALLNTSFNLHGKPIVCTARDAIDAFVKSGLDGLILPNFLIMKHTKDLSAPILQDTSHLTAAR